MLLQLVSAIIGGIGAIVGAAAELFPEKRRRPAKVTGLIVAALGFALSLILLMESERSEAAKAAEARRTTDEQLQLLRVVATALHSIEIAALFEMPGDSPGLSEFRDALFERVDGWTATPLDVGAVSAAGMIDGGSGAHIVSAVRFIPAGPGLADVSKFRESSSTPMVYLRNLGVRASLYSKTSEDLPGPGDTPIMELFPSVVIQPEYRFSGRGAASRTWCRFRFGPADWHSVTALPSIYDFNGAWFVISIGAADGDRLNIDSDPGTTVDRLLDETALSGARIRLNEAELDLERHFVIERVDPSTNERARYYSLPRDFFDPMRGRAPIALDDQ